MLASTLNMSEAAEKLGVGQAAISKSLKNLELQLGEILFYRTNRGLVITESGQVLRKHLTYLSQYWGDNFEKERVEKDEFRGRFTIGAHQTIAVTHFPLFFPALNEQFEQLSCFPVFGNSRELTKKVLNFEIDCAIVVNPTLHPDLIISKMSQEKVQTYRNEDLSPQDIVYYNPEMILAEKILKKYKDYKFIAVADYEVLSQVSETSGGLFLLPNPVAQRKNCLKVIDKCLLEVDVCFIYHSQKYKSQSFKYIIDTIKKQKK